MPILDYKHVLLAAAAMMASTLTLAQSNVTVYGIVDAAVEASNAGRGTLMRLDSGGGAGSRLGFRGLEDLGGGMAAVFRLEQGFNTDDGTLGQGGRTFGREASVGLQSSTLGTVTLGRIPLPYYQVLSSVDAFGWIGPGGMLAIDRSTAATTRQLLPTAVNARLDNSVAYMSPVLGGMVVRALVSAGEGSTTQGRGYSGSVAFVQGPINVVAAGSRLQGTGNLSANGRADAATIGGSYDFQVTKLFAGYTMERNSCTTCTGALARVVGVGTGTSESDFRLINVGVRVPFGSAVAVAQATRIQDKSAYAAPTGNRDATLLAIGGEYAMSKRTLLYVGYATINNRNGSFYAMGSGTAQQNANAVGPGDPRAKTFAAGIRHSF